MTTVATRVPLASLLPLPLTSVEPRAVTPVREIADEGRSRAPGRARPTGFIAGAAAIDAGAERRGGSDRRAAGSLQIGSGATTRPSSPFLAQQLAAAPLGGADGDGPGHRTAHLAYARALGQAIDIIGPAGANGILAGQSHFRICRGVTGDSRCSKRRF